MDEIKISDKLVKSLEKDKKTLEKQINSLLQKYKMCEQKLGQITGYKHQIKLNNKTLFYSKSYPVPLKYKNIMSNHLKELQQSGLIQDSLPPYSSPVFIKVKPNGKPRLIGDHKKLNSLTITEPWLSNHTGNVQQSPRELHILTNRSKYGVSPNRNAR